MRNEDLDLETTTFWITVKERLFMERVIFLSGIINNSKANGICALMLFLNSLSDDFDDILDDSDDILLYINSRGGEARAAITIYDIMNSLVLDVNTLVTGLAASSASLILSGGTIGKRAAFPNARITIHQPVAGPFSGPPHILASEAEGMLELRNTIATIYAQTTGNLLRVVQKDLEREKYMSATEAQAYGIIDHVTEPADKTKPIERDISNLGWH